MSWSDIQKANRYGELPFTGSIMGWGKCICQEVSKEHDLVVNRHLG